MEVVEGGKNNPMVRLMPGWLLAGLSRKEPCWVVVSGFVEIVLGFQREEGLSGIVPSGLCEAPYPLSPKRLFECLTIRLG